MDKRTLARNLVIASFALPLTATAIHADVVGESSLELLQLQILPSTGTVLFTSPVTASAFTQVFDTLGGFAQGYQSSSGGAASANASTSLAHATASASALLMTMTSESGVNIPAAVHAFAGTVPGNTQVQLEGSYEIVGDTATPKIRLPPPPWTQTHP